MNLLPDIQAYFFVALGVFVGVVIPIISVFMREGSLLARDTTLPSWLRKYAVLFVFSLLVALIVLAAWKRDHPADELSWFSALLLGFAWESVLEKISMPTIAPRQRPDGAADAR